MISVSEIYDSLISIIRKDKRGLSMSIDDFNKAIVPVNQRIYRLNYHDWESSKLAMDELGSFKVVAHQIDLTSGVGALPANYYHLVGEPYYNHLIKGKRKIDLITSLEHNNREMDYLTKASLLYPTAFMGYGATSDDMSIYVDPTTIEVIYIDYLRKVNTPLLDYYIDDTTFEITYLDEAEGVTIPAGCTGRLGQVPGSNYTAATLNFEWHEHDIPSLLNLLLETVGIQLQDQGLVQVSNTDLPIIEQK